MSEEKDIVNEHQKLICSKEFETALEEGAEIRSEINNTYKSRNKDNYDRFYDIMLMSRDDINEILEKKKKNRTPSEIEAVKKFNKTTKMQYKFVKDMIFISEDEKLNDDGTTNTVPKKVAQIVDKISAVIDILKYIGLDIPGNVLVKEFENRGIKIDTESLEKKYSMFTNPDVRKDIIDIFTTSCSIQKDVDFKESEITQRIFTESVPSDLQYDKQTNPAGLHDSDFKKLVSLKYKKMKSDALDEEAKEKTADAINIEAEKKTFEITRNETIRAGLMQLGLTEDDDGNSETEIERNF